MDWSVTNPLPIVQLIHGGGGNLNILLSSFPLSNFSSPPHLTLILPTLFCGTYHFLSLALLSISSSSSITLTHPLTIPRQSNRHTVLHHSTSPRAAGGKFPLHCAEYFLYAFTLFLLSYCNYGRGRGVYSRGGVEWII